MIKFNKLSPMLYTEDIQQTLDFYTKVLGFKLDSMWPEEKPVWCSLDHGDVHVMFYSDENGKQAAEMTGHLYIYTEDIRALHKKISDKVEVLWGPEVYHYGMREFAIKDCNGYTLTFGEPTDDPVTCEEN